MPRKKYCCERFKESIKDNIIVKSNSNDETEYYVNNSLHIYYCPYCGVLIKGSGWGDYDKKYSYDRAYTITAQKILKVYPRPNSYVIFNYEGIPENYHNKYPFKKNEIYIYLGEIPNLLGHCNVSDLKTGKIYSGYHIENFKEVPFEYK